MESHDRPRFDPSKSLVVYVERVFDAPRESIWKALTDPIHIARWWGPPEFTVDSAKIDLRVGGKYLFSVRNPYQDFWSTGTYLEIDYPNKIVETDSFGDEQGNLVSPGNFGMEGDYPLELLITLTIEEIAPGKTKLTVKHEGMPNAEQVENGKTFWQASFDKLEKALPEIR